MIFDHDAAAFANDDFRIFHFKVTPQLYAAPWPRRAGAWGGATLTALLRTVLLRR